MIKPVVLFPNYIQEINRFLQQQRYPKSIIPLKMSVKVKLNIFNLLFVKKNLHGNGVFITCAWPTGTKSET